MRAPSPAPITAGPTTAPASSWAPPTRWASPASISRATGWCACRPPSATACCSCGPSPCGRARAPTIDVDAGLGPLAADLAALKLDTYPMFSADRVAPRINWKFAIDTFLEGYHIPHLHRKTIAPYFIGNCGTFDGAGLHGRMCVATHLDRRRARACPRANATTGRTSSRSTSSSPTPSLIWQVDHIEIWRAFPGRDDASRCDVEMTIYKPADSDAARRLLGEEPRHRHPHGDGGGLPAGRAHADRLRIGRHRRGDLRPQRAVAGPFP